MIKLQFFKAVIRLKLVASYDKHKFLDTLSNLLSQRVKGWILVHEMDQQYFPDILEGRYNTKYKLSSKRINSLDIMLKQFPLDVKGK